MRVFVTVIGFVLSLGLLGCGGNGGTAYCAAAAACAKKGGNTFSETACQTNATTLRELAASKVPNCTAQFDEQWNCVSGLTCESVTTPIVTCANGGDCWSNSVYTNCGGKIDAYNKCMQ